ncbi:hypothetical protein RZS08_18520, partial [Arthrospira platensis SPKY1]|nr:hypothetical protein [Arthrospira platensis SPKY1]
MPSRAAPSPERGDAPPILDRGARMDDHRRARVETLQHLGQQPAALADPHRSQPRPAVLDHERRPAIVAPEQRAGRHGQRVRALPD